MIELQQVSKRHRAGDVETTALDAISLAIEPGEYVVRFFFANVKVERPGVLISADKTISISAAIPTAKAQVQEIRVTERAPTVDVATTQVQTQVSDELAKNTPVGRSYTSVLSLAPGSATDAVGLPPKEVILVQAGSVPKTSSGKLQRSACRLQYLADELDRLERP